MRAQFIPQSAYMKIKQTQILQAPTLTTYSAGDDFNPNGLETSISDLLKTFAVKFNESYYEDLGTPLTTSDTYENIQIYETHSRGSVNQNITVS